MPSEANKARHCNLVLSSAKKSTQIQVLSPICPKRSSKKKSFYCLKRFSDNYESKICRSGSLCSFRSHSVARSTQIQRENCIPIDENMH